jgi:hypothetical protein
MSIYTPIGMILMVIGLDFSNKTVILRPGGYYLVQLLLGFPLQINGT